MFALLGALALVVVAAAWVVAAERRDPEPRARGRLPHAGEPEQAAPLHADVVLDGSVAWAPRPPESPSVAIVVRDADAERLRIGPLCGPFRELATRNGEPTKGLGWSADGEWLIWAPDQIERVSVATGSRAAIVHMHGVAEVDVSPTGDRVFFTASPTDGGRRRPYVAEVNGDRLIDLSDPLADGDVRAAAVAWNARTAILSVARLRPNLHQLWQVSLDGHDAKEIGASRTVALAITEDGRTLFARDAWSIGLAGEWRRHVWHRDDLLVAAWSPDGRWLAAVTVDGALWLLAPGENRAMAIARPSVPPDGGVARRPVWSPDGRFLAFWLASGGPTPACLLLDRRTSTVCRLDPQIVALAWRDA